MADTSVLVLKVCVDATTFDKVAVNTVVSKGVPSVLVTVKVIGPQLKEGFDVVTIASVQVKSL